LICLEEILTNGYKKSGRSKQAAQSFAWHFSKKERSALCDKALIRLLVIPQNIMASLVVKLKKGCNGVTASLRLADVLKLRTNV